MLVLNFIKNIDPTKLLPAIWNGYKRSDEALYANQPREYRKMAASMIPTDIYSTKI